MNRKLNIVFVHPDLGIGGAERLVVDAALALKSSGHSVRFLTCHHDKNHCFDETSDGTFDVCTIGDFLPRQIFGRCRAFFAYLRSIFAVFYLIFLAGWHYDLLFVDQISAPILFLKVFTNAKILFYCHFPDLLLTKKDNFFKKIYRAPIDRLEEWTTGMADCILVNSKFTAKTFRNTFKSLQEIKLQVLYPCVSQSLLARAKDDLADKSSLSDLISFEKRHYFLSLNRYERKKDVSLAIQALGVLQSKVSENEWSQVHLVVAGGYDDHNPENIQHYTELAALAENLQLIDHVTFLKSPKEDAKLCLLSNCLALVYTPSHEHFGIVPVEAMVCSRPVIGVNNGGLLETVDDGRTGLLVDSDSEKFADAMKYFLENPDDARRFGETGRKRALNLFSFDAFAEKLNEICSNF